MRFHMMLAAAALALGLVVACGVNSSDRKEAEGPSPTSNTPPVGGALVAPDVFMTFEGRRYRVQEELASLDSTEMALVGTTEAIDVDHERPVEVYRLENSSNGMLYTLHPLTEGEGGSMPDVWLMWAPVEGRPGETGSVEPGSAGGVSPAAPGATLSQPPVGEPAAPSPGSGATASPDDVVSATPVPDTDVPPGSTADPSTLAEKARADLAQRLGMGVEAVEIVSVVQEWLPHQSCLNLEPGAACIEIAVDGYRVTLRAQGTEYAYYGYPEGDVYPVP